jgi:glutamate dehydrogenase (NADP+)
MHNYAKEVLNSLVANNGWEEEFIQAVTEVFQSITPILEGDARYVKNRILERITEPERTIMFKVPWKDDRGEYHVNRGYRVEFNSALGPYKGGLRFHSSVTLSILKFLGFEQIFKNALTGLPMGGGKGGSNFNPRGKSDSEIMNFCQSYMSELFRHIGANTDVPAGDIGVGGREIGYMFGQYKRLKNTFEGVFTGKGMNWGGSLLRPEATGFGTVYFIEEMLKTKMKSLEGMKVAISGFGNVSWGVAKKIYELGGKVITLSGPDGFIHDKAGLTPEKIDYMIEMRNSCNDSVEDYLNKFKVDFYPNKKPWGVKCDIAIPCATQNEMEEEDVKSLLKNGCFCVAEAANFPIRLEGIKLLQESGILYAPGKAVNAGGVAVSGLEMSQNSMRISWTKEEVDEKLKRIMKNIHDECLNTANQYGKPGNYVYGSNIFGFIKVASAMIEQGLCS